jgi:hypothetical protein
MSEKRRKFMKKVFIPFMIVLAYAIMAYSTPTWMWIGRYLADSSYCGIPLYPQSRENAEDFLIAANACHPNGPTPVPKDYLSGINVTHTVVTGNSSQRNLCDFVFFIGHGDQFNGVVIWNDAQTACATMATTEMNFGSVNYGGTRWVLLHSCQTLTWHGPYFWTAWGAAFQGVQCVMGFASDGGVGSYSAAAMKTFWYYWTGIIREQKDDGQGIRPLLFAYFDAVYWDMILREGGSEPDVTYSPAMITSSNGSHHFWDDNYYQATSSKAPVPSTLYYTYEELQHP